MKFRSFLNLVAAIAAALLLLGTIGFVWVFAQSPLGLLKGTDQTPTAAMFVPKQAPLMASLVVNPDRLGTLRQVLAKPGDRARTRSEFEQFEQGILGNELDYQRDVKPWLGNEITTAITTIDVDRDAENGKETGYLLALSTKDTQRSREFLQLFWQKRAIAGTELVFEPYKGTKIIYGKVATDSIPMTIASAVVGNQYVLFANSPKVLRDALSNVQAADLNLENSSTYQQAIAALDRSRVGLVYVNLPELAALNGQDTAIASGAAISLGLDRSGIIADSAIVGGSEASVAKSPVDALKYIPAIAPISASGINLDRLWSGLSQGVSGNTAKLVNQSIETLNKRWQIDLPKDIFSWVKGEYALGLVPRSPNLDWVFVADKSADPEAEAAIAHLDEVAKSQGLSTGSIQVGDQPVSVWTRLESSIPTKDALAAEVAGAHTTIGKYEIFATSIEAMNTVLNAKKNVLANSKDFESAIAGLQKNNNGYLYIDWETAQPILESRLPVLKLIELAGQPLFERLRSITVSNYGNQSGIQRSGALIRLS